MDIDQFPALEGGKTLQAIGYPGRLAVRIGQQREGVGQRSQGCRQIFPHMGSQRRPAAHGVLRVAIEQVDNIAGVARIAIIGANHFYVHAGPVYLGMRGGGQPRRC